MKDKKYGITEQTSDKELFEKFFKVEHIGFKDDDVESLFRWKSKVWDKCIHKKVNVTSDGIGYICKLNNKNCDFKNCSRK